MNLTQGQFQILGIAILFCLTLIIMFGMAMDSLVGEKGLILKSQFVKNKKELTDLLKDKTEGVKNALLVDTIGFIPVYFLLFILITWFLSQQENYFSKYFAISAGVFAIATIFFDLAENLKIFDGFRENSHSEPLNIANVAIGKWVCFFITVAILSSAFWKPHYLMQIIAGLLLIGSIMGLISTILGKYQLIQFSVMSIILGMIFVGISFTFFSRQLWKKFLVQNE